MLGVSAVLLYYANKQKEMGSVPAACTQAVCSTAALLISRRMNTAWVPPIGRRL